jgi:hypothetical protein
MYYREFATPADDTPNHEPLVTEEILTEDIPVRLIEGSELLAKRLTDVVGDRLLTAAGCLYWPLADVHEATEATGKSRVVTAVEQLQNSRYTALHNKALHVELGFDTAPMCKPGEAVPLQLQLKARDADELLVESRLLTLLLQKDKVPSTTHQDLQLNLVDGAVTYSQFVAAGKILRPYIYRSRRLSPVVVAPVPKRT